MTSLILDLDRCPFFFVHCSWTKKDHIARLLTRLYPEPSTAEEEEQEEHAHMRLQSTSQLKRG